MSPIKGSLFVISAPSGAGKTSLVRALIADDEHIAVSVSHTTRPIRPGETDGVNYHFVSRDEFVAAQKQGAFFEWAEVFGNLYGTSKAALQQQLDQGVDVILEIDWQGASQVQKLINDCCTIFILPPSRATLEERLLSRGQDDSQTIARRMAEATSEMSHFDIADFVILNDDFDTALADLIAIVRSVRLRRSVQEQRLATLINGLIPTGSA